MTWYKYAFIILLSIMFIFSNIQCHVDNYELIYKALNWSDASIACSVKNAHLAVPMSKEDFSIIQNIVRKMKYNNIVNLDGSAFRGMVWVGVNNINDEHLWKTVTDINLEDAEFNKFADQDINYNSNEWEPHCAGIDAVNNGYRTWWCHRRLPFVCEFMKTN